MNLSQFLERRRRISSSVCAPRVYCQKCHQPTLNCFCAHLKDFDPKMKFVILIHPIEAKRRIATGRMSHLSLVGSHLIVGQDYTVNPEVNSILSDSRYFPVILSPMPPSANLTRMSDCEKASLFPRDKIPSVFVVDGTWRLAWRMLDQSKNLQHLPRVCFTPSRASRFRVRKQPAPECYSTIEAIHETIELLGSACGFDVHSRQHDQLLSVFDHVVERQLRYVKNTRG